MPDGTVIDEFFLPVLFAIHASSLFTVLYDMYSLKSTKESSLWNGIMVLLLLLAATSFLLQAMNSWKIDLLHQFGLISVPVLWQRLLSGFLLAHKLTIDIAENYCITSQLLSFVLPLVAFINMQRRHMDIPLFVIGTYLGLGLTGSYGGTLALFLVRLYNSGSTSPSSSCLTLWETCLQVASTIGGCFTLVFLGQVTLSQMKIAAVPILCTIFIVPFLSSANVPDKKLSNKSGKSFFVFYFFTLLGLFIILHHFYLTYLFYTNWMGFKAFLLVAFGYPYQHAISVDVISCMVMSAIFVTLELHKASFLRSDLRGFILIKILGTLLSSALLALILSPGGLFSLFLAVREHYLGQIHFV